MTSRFEYTAIGTVANLSARLCGEAANGQILISGPVHGVVQELVETEELGALTLKGFHRPIAALLRRPPPNPGGNSGPWVL